MSAAQFNLPGVPNTDFLKPSASDFVQYPDAANDVCQETWHSVLANQEKNYNGTNVKGRLHTIMRNIFINDRRRPKPKIVFDNISIDYLISQKQALFSALDVNSLCMQKIYHSICELPGIFQKPFLLYFNGSTYDEISAKLHEPTETIILRLHFAWKLLKQQISRN